MNEDWIYFLKLSKRLGPQFFHLDQALKRYDFSLVPIELSGLGVFSRSARQVHIICIARNSQELLTYNRGIRKLLKFYLGRSNINFYLLSSFENLNDKNRYNKGNYFYTPIPVAYEAYAKIFARVHRLKSSGANKWPGHSRRVYPAGEKL